MANTRQRPRISLGAQLLLAQLLLFLLIAVPATVTGIHLLQQRLSQANEERLKQVQELTYRDFKHREQLLWEQLRAAKNSQMHIATGQPGSLQLHDQRISLAVITDKRSHLPQPLRDLSNRCESLPDPIIAVLHYPEENRYNLSACGALTDKQLLLLQQPLDSDYLNELHARYALNFYLLNHTGAIIAANTAARFLPSLSGTELAQLHAGKSFVNRAGRNAAHLVAYKPLPLGSDGLFILATAQPLEPLSQLLKNYRTYSLLAITLILALNYIISGVLCRQLQRNVPAMPLDSDELSRNPGDSSSAADR